MSRRSSAEPAGTNTSTGSSGLPDQEAVALRVWGRESGVETDVSFNQVVDFRNGKAMRLRSFIDREGALEAAGLSEWPEKYRFG